jgi:predicted nicotinamide N-methyase
MSIYPSLTLLSSFAPLTSVPHCESIIAHIAPDFFKLWENFEQEQGHVTEIPYWAAVWPGAKSLAAYILKNPDLVEGKKVLDFGSGSGVASIAAVKAGAKLVIANDIDPVAQFVAKQNFLANNADIETSFDNLLMCEDDNLYDLILVSDMFYERSTAQPLHNFLKKNINMGSQILIADGTRPFTPRGGLQEILNEVIPVNKELEGMAERRVSLFMMGGNFLSSFPKT